MDYRSIRYIDENQIIGKKVLLRVDFNVPQNEDGSISDDARILGAIPTIEYLLKNQNRIILVFHLGEPEGRDTKYTVKPVVERLKILLPSVTFRLVDDFLTEKEVFKNQNEREIVVLENIRFYKEEQEDPNSEFSKHLSELAEVYVNDGFAVCHRNNCSVVGVSKYIPSYGGFLLKREIEMISSIFNNPVLPLTAIIGGAKITTKISLISKLMDVANDILIGGGLANTFLAAQGYNIANSYFEPEEIEEAKKILLSVAQSNCAIHLPMDVVLGDTDPTHTNEYIKKISEVNKEDNMILDLGPETQARFGAIISKSNTIVWNGPMGYIEKGEFKRSTDFIYYSILNNLQAKTIIGGGDTLAAIVGKEHLDQIDHISTGGGAMLDFIEKGTLPGIEALIAI